MKKRDKRQPRIETIKQLFYPASDGWHRQYPRNTVSVRLFAYYNPDKVGTIRDGLIRMSVGGNDNASMMKELQFKSSGSPEFESKLKELSNWLESSLPNPLTKEWLKEQGFLWD